MLTLGRPTPQSQKNCNLVPQTIAIFDVTYFKQFKHIFLYGLVLAILVFVLKWLQWKFLIVDHSIDIYIGLIAVFFTILGVWVAKQLIKPVVLEKKIVVSPPGEFKINEPELQKLNLSNREYEVLQLLADGHTNADIANRLFLSVSTIKSPILGRCIAKGAQYQIRCGQRQPLRC